MIKNQTKRWHKIRIKSIFGDGSLRDKKLFEFVYKKVKAKSRNLAKGVIKRSKYHGLHESEK